MSNSKAGQDAVDSNNDGQLPTEVVRTIGGPGPGRPFVQRVEKMSAGKVVATSYCIVDCGHVYATTATTPKEAVGELGMYEEEIAQRKYSELTGSYLALFAPDGIRADRVQLTTIDVQTLDSVGEPEVYVVEENQSTAAAAVFSNPTPTLPRPGRYRP